MTDVVPENAVVAVAENVAVAEVAAKAVAEIAAVFAVAAAADTVVAESVAAAADVEMNAAIVETVAAEVEHLAKLVLILAQPPWVAFVVQVSRVGLLHGYMRVSFPEVVLRSGRNLHLTVDDGEKKALLKDSHQYVLFLHSKVLEY